MKILVDQKEEGLLNLIGKKVFVMCANYFYHGQLVGVNKSCIKLEDPSIVYDTGAWTNDKFSDEQMLNVKHWYVKVSAIESFGEK